MSKAFKDKQDKKDFKQKSSKDFSRKGFGKGNRKDSFDHTEAPTHNMFGKGANDVSWYMLTENLGKSVASLPYNIMTGTKEAILPTEFTTSDNIKVENKSLNATPGVMTISYLSVPGTSTNATSAVNVASRAIYSFVRHENSGAKNYEAPDLMIYILGMAQAYNLILEAKRIYRLAMTYDGVNRYIPDLLIRSLGANPQSIRENLAQFRYGINLAIAKLSSLYIPKQFNLFKRQALLSTVVLTDSSSIRSQFYTFRLKAYYKFTGTVSQGSTLIASAIGDNRSYEQILTEINDVIDTLLADEDINIMSGDILKAYKVEGCFSIPELNESETQEFLFDEDLLNQIENAYSGIVNMPGGNYPSITQTGGYVLFNPTFTDGSASETYQDGASLGNYIASHDRYFNSHKDAPDFKDNLEWSRLAVSATYTDTTSGYYNVASELVTDFRIWTNQYVGNSSSPITRQMIFTSVLPTVELWDQFDLISTLSMFDWHPILYLARQINTNPKTIRYFGALYDAKVHTIVSSDVITRMNDSAIMGLLSGGVSIGR